MQRRFFPALMLSIIMFILAACATTVPEVKNTEPYIRPQTQPAVVEESPPARIIEEPLDVQPPLVEPSLVEDFDWQSEDESVSAPSAEGQVEDVGGSILILPEVSHVNARLNVYADKISRWKPLTDQFDTLNISERKPQEWDDCLASVEQAFEGYSQLLELTLKARDTVMDLSEVTVDPWRVYQWDIAYLDSGCDKVFMTGTAMVSGWMDRYSDSAVEESEAVVGEYAEKGQFEDAIVAYQNLLASYPDKQASIETRKTYGLALLRTGNLDGATAVLSEILAEMDLGPEERSVRRLVADLLLATGQFNEAMEHYKKLNDFFTTRRGDDRWVADQIALLEGVDDTAPELPLFRKVLESFIVFDGRHMPDNMRENVDRLAENYMGSHFVYRAQAMLREVEDEVRGWFGNRLVLVDEMVEKKEFDKAVAVLEDVLKEDLSAGMRDVAQKTLDDVVLAKMQDEEMQRQILEESQSAQWEKANNLYGLQKYDEAISAFSALYGTDYDDQARAKVIATINLAAADLRRQAASLFVKARKTNDYDQKKELFVESWELLRKIIDKYPNADIINKVKQNLKILEEQFLIFDPILFEEVTSPSRPIVEPIPLEMERYP